LRADGRSRRLIPLRQFDAMMWAISPVAMAASTKSPFALTQ
jgi:hypothetical protein